MSEEDLSNFDDDFFKIRSKIASENMEWFKLFKRRNNLMILMILSVVLVNTLFIILELSNNLFNPSVLLLMLIIPNFTWSVICLPYFYFQLKKLTKQIEEKREEAVMLFFNKNKNVKDIALSTGIRIDFVEYYLTKNNIVFEHYTKNKS